MDVNKSKVIRLSMEHLISPYTNVDDVDDFYKDSMMIQFKRAVAELKPEDIINIRDEGSIRKYDIDVVIKKY